MHITESDLFYGLDQNVLNKITDISSEEQLDDGAVLFREGEAADNLFILEEGIVDLSIDQDTFIYSVMEPGEIFGWSSLVESAKYTAKATSKSNAKAIKIPTDRLQRIFDDHPEISSVVYKRLAGIFNNRLTKTYRKFLAALSK